MLLLLYKYLFKFYEISYQNIYLMKVVYIIIKVLNKYKIKSNYNNIFNYKSVSYTYKFVRELLLKTKNWMRQLLLELNDSWMDCISSRQRDWPWGMNNSFKISTYSLASLQYTTRQHQYLRTITSSIYSFSFISSCQQTSSISLQVISPSNSLFLFIYKCCASVCFIKGNNCLSIYFHAQ